MHAPRCLPPAASFSRQSLLHCFCHALQPTNHLQPVQGSITSWRANCASFASLGALSHLARLSLHAFHCPGAHLAAALLRLSGLEELRLSGRVVLEPLAALSRLGRLQVGGNTVRVHTHALGQLGLPRRPSYACLLLLQLFACPLMLSDRGSMHELLRCFDDSAVAYDTWVLLAMLGAASVARAVGH